MKKFSKNILENRKDFGGLQLPNLYVFDNALKISWIRRIIAQDSGWSLFPKYYGIDKIIFYGDLNIGKLKSTIKYIFWIDCLKALQLLWLNYQLRNI